MLHGRFCVSGGADTLREIPCHGISEEFEWETVIVIASNFISHYSISLGRRLRKWTKGNKHDDLLNAKTPSQF